MAFDRVPCLAHPMDPWSAVRPDGGRRRHAAGWPDLRLEEVFNARLDRTVSRPPRLGVSPPGHARPGPLREYMASDQRRSSGSARFSRAPPFSFDRVPCLARPIDPWSAVRPDGGRRRHVAAGRISASRRSLCSSDCTDRGRIPTVSRGHRQGAPRPARLGIALAPLFDRRPNFLDLVEGEPADLEP